MEQPGKGLKVKQEQRDLEVLLVVLVRGCSRLQFIHLRLQLLERLDDLLAVRSRVQDHRVLCNTQGSAFLHRS